METKETTKDVKQYEMTLPNGIGVYCGTYRKYNDGNLFGMWIDLEQFTYAEDFFDVCRELHGDEEDPEFMFQDFQGFPEEFYHESMNIDDIQKILDYIALDDNDKEMIEDYCQCFGGDLEDFGELLDKANGRYQGKYDSFSEFASSRADEDIACMSVRGATEWFERYFDYDAYERDLQYDYCIGDNGCGFCSSY